MTHDELVQLTATKVEKLFRCGLILREMSSSKVNFFPDVFAVKKCGITFQFEIKVSLKDFLADKKKKHRIDNCYDVGDYRYYVVPKGLIPHDNRDLTCHTNWGLIEVTEGGQFEIAKGLDPKNGLTQFEDNLEVEDSYWCKKNSRAEMELVYAARMREVLASEVGEIKIKRIVEKVQRCAEEVEKMAKVAR